MRLLAVLLVIGLTACIPAQTPPQLEFTPGTPLVITDTYIELEGVQIRYPAGWRVITGAAENPPTVTFVAPEDQALITVSVSGETLPPQLPITSVREARTQIEVLSGTLTFHIWFMTSPNLYQQFLPVYQDFLRTLSSKH